MLQNTPHDHHHHHDPAQKKRQINRLSRIIGHLEHIKKQIASDADCADVITQIAATKSALNGVAKQIINEHIEHCIAHAIEEKNPRVIEDFQKAIERFIK